MEQKWMLLIFLCVLNMCFGIVFASDREMGKSVGGRKLGLGAETRARLASLQHTSNSLRADSVRDAVPASVQTGGPRLLEDYFGKKEERSPCASSVGLEDFHLQGSLFGTPPIPVTARSSRKSPDSNISPLAIDVLRRSVHAKSAGDAGMVYEHESEEDGLGKSAPEKTLHGPVGVVNAVLCSALAHTKSEIQELSDDVEDDGVDALVAQVPLQSRIGLVTTEGLGEAEKSDGRTYFLACTDNTPAVKEADAREDVKEPIGVGDETFLVSNFKQICWLAQVLEVFITAYKIPFSKDDVLAVFSQFQKEKRLKGESLFDDEHDIVFACVQEDPERLRSDFLEPFDLSVHRLADILSRNPSLENKIATILTLDLEFSLLLSRLEKEKVESTEPFWPEGEVPKKTWTAKDGTRCAFFRYKDPTYGAFLVEVFSGEAPV